MSKSKKKILFVSALVLMILAPITSPALSQEARPLEVQYPTVPGAPTPTTVETPLPDYVKYIFNFAIWGSGFIALVVLVIAGFRYITSTGRPEILNDARDQIFAALIGLLILFSSWLILTTINPQLAELQIKKPPPVIPALLPGIYLCKEETDEIAWTWEKNKEIKRLFLTDPNDPTIVDLVNQVNEWLKTIEQNCWLAAASGEIVEKFNDKAKYAYTVPSEKDDLYGAILYDESKFGGRAQVVYTLTSKVGKFGVTKIKPSSVRLFVLKQPRPEVYVEIYELIDFNRADPRKQSAKHTLSGLASPYIDTSGFPTVGSGKIEGDLIVIFFKDAQTENWPEDAIIDVVVSTDANFYDNLIGRWCWRWAWTLYEYYPCPKQMVIVSAGIY